MQTKTVSIPSISCEHCRHTIERELAELDGVGRVVVDVPSRTATVTWEEPATWPILEETLAELGYAPAA